MSGSTQVHSPKEKLTCRFLIDDSVPAMFNSTVGTVRNPTLSLLILPEYADLDLVTAAMLVNNSKQTAQAAQPPAPSYGYNPPMQYTQPALNPFQPAPAAQSNNISNIISSLDPATLSQLLGAMSQQNSMPQNPQPAAGLSLDLARLLAQVSSPSHTPGPTSPALPQIPQLGQPQYNALAAMLGGQAQSAAPPVQQPAPQPAGAPDMNEIMAQLAKYQR